MYNARTFSLSMLAIAAIGLKAQPTLTTGQLAYVIGEYTMYQSCLQATWPQNGAGITWSYANLNCSAGGFDNIVDPALTPGAAYYPTATAMNGDANAGLYYRSTATSEEYLGYYITQGGYLGACSDVRIDWQYPFTYGDSFTDELHCDEDGAMPRTRSGSQTISCTGYGTLILPYGSFTDCLLITKTWNYQDDYGIPGAEGVVTGEARLFVHPGTHAVLLSISSSAYTQAGQTITSSGVSMLDQLSTGSDGALHAKSEQFILVPNPANGPVTLVRESGSAATVEVFTMDGRALLHDRLPAGCQRHPLETAGLATGSYLVRVVSAGDATVAVLVVD
jgi:hypothetical protein